MISIQSQQILVPKSVYIGDTAELQCSFNYSSPSFISLVQNGTAVLSLENFEGDLDFMDYEIKSVTLSQTGVDFYQLTVTFIPWKTGEIQFPSYKLKGMTINFEPITIVSLTEQNSINVIRESTGPLLLPGTTYKLYSFIILIIIFLILLIRGIIRHKQIMFFIKSIQLKLKYRKNAKSTQKKLRLILRPDISSKDAACEIQQIMRHYLEVRFEYPFTKVVTSEMMKVYYDITTGILAERKEIAFGDIVSSFIRTDYIRYSSNAEFAENEKQELIKNLITNIVTIEIPSKEKNDENAGGENV